MTELDHLLRKLDGIGRGIANTQGYVFNLTEFMFHTFNVVCMGHGYYSAVYKHPDDPSKVIKITPSNNSGKYGDGYLDFLFWIARNYPDAPCFPKIYDIHIHDHFTLVEMEHLIPVHDNDTIALREFMETFSTGGRDLGFPGHLADIAKCMADCLGKPSDVASRNVMRRLNGDGTEDFVLTDPYCHRSAPYHNRAERYIVNGKIDLTVEIYPCSHWSYDEAIRRAKMANLSSIAAFRKEAQDRVLREQPKHDHREHPERVQGPLLQTPGAWWLRAEDWLVKQRTDRNKIVGNRTNVFVVDSVDAAIAFVAGDFPALERRIGAKMAVNQWLVDRPMPIVQNQLPPSNKARCNPTGRVQIPGPEIQVLAVESYQDALGRRRRRVAR